MFIRGFYNYLIECCIPLLLPCSCLSVPLYASTKSAVSSVENEMGHLYFAIPRAQQVKMSTDPKSTLQVEEEGEWVWGMCGRRKDSKDREKI